MPAKSSKQYSFMQAAAHGNLRNSIGPSKAVAEEFIHKTPAKTRSKFARQLGKKRKKVQSKGEY